MSEARQFAPDDRTVSATLEFIVPQDTKPYFESAALTGAEPKVHFRTKDRLVDIHDMRPLAGRLSIDREGFELRVEPTSIGDFYDFDEVDERYGKELEGMLRRVTGASRAATFDFTRRSDAPSGAANRDGLRGPASRVHVDYTVDSGPKRARDALGADRFDAVIAAGGRVAQVNVWRPIRGPVRRAPLALGDASSIGAGDLVATEQIFPDRVGEIYYINHEPGQRWYWAPEMERNEVILIKGWDSLDDGRARFAPHGAFVLPDQEADAPPRESIEARTYLIFDA